MFDKSDRSCPDERCACETNKNISSKNLFYKLNNKFRNFRCCSCPNCRSTLFHELWLNNEQNQCWTCVSRCEEKKTTFSSTNLCASWENIYYKLVCYKFHKQLDRPSSHRNKRLERSHSFVFVTFDQWWLSELIDCWYRETAEERQACCSVKVPMKNCFCCLVDDHWRCAFAEEISFEIVSHKTDIDAANDRHSTVLSSK